MSKLETNFLTSEERLSLIRDHKLEKDGRKRDRMKFILLYNDGWSYAQIAKVLLLDDQTLRNYLKDYESGGMKSLLRRPFKTRGKKFFLIFKLKPQNPFSNYIVFVLRF